MCAQHLRPARGLLTVKRAARGKAPLAVVPVADAQRPVELFVDIERAIGQALSWTTSTGGKEGRPDLLLLNSRMHNQFKDRQRAKQRVEVPYKAAQDLGFDDVMNFDGVGITMDFDVPANTGYLMNFDKMELLCLYDQLFYPRGPEYDIKTDSYLLHIGFFGNCRMRPRHFAKLKNYA